MELTAATSLFLEDRARLNRSPMTLAWYRSVLELFARDSGASALETVSLDTMRGYVVFLQSSPGQRPQSRMSSVTVRKKVLAIKTFFAWAKAKRLIESDPCAELTAPSAPRRLPRALNVDQARLLLAVPVSVRDHAILAVLLDTGIRLSEACALDLSDVDDVQGTILIRRGKGGKQRVVVFESETRDALRAWLMDRSRRKVVDYDALFLAERTGKRFTRFGLYKAVKRIAAAAGLSDVASPHKLRHTFASTYLDGGGGIQDLSTLMGHTEISTTWVYTKVAVSGLRKKHAAFSPLKAMGKD